MASKLQRNVDTPQQSERTSAVDNGPSQVSDEERPGVSGDAVVSDDKGRDGEIEAKEKIKSEDSDTCPKCDGGNGSHASDCGNRYRACWAIGRVSKAANTEERKG